jgi:hypothetical protein
VLKREAGLGPRFEARWQGKRGPLRSTDEAENEDQEQVTV